MYRYVVCFLLFFSFRAFSQDAPALLHRAAQLDSAFKEDQSLQLYQQVLRLQPHNIAALCACCDLSCRIGNRQDSRDKKLSYFKAGQSYAGTALQLDSNNSNVNLEMAFSIGRMILLESGREKVAGAGAIKRYAEKAIRLDPRSYKAWHILGRWHYEVSNLNFFERTLARWFYGALPDASLKEAITDYEKSMALQPQFIINYLELAKACRRDDQKARAIRLLRHIDTLPDEMYDDRQVRQEAKRLLAELED
jgi:hypothetical protein